MGIQIGAAEIITGTLLRNLIMDSLPSFGIYIPDVGTGTPPVSAVNETLVERVTITHTRANGSVYIGRGHTLATFRHCNITPYITGSPLPIPGIVIVNAANILFDSCEGNANPGSVWLDFQSTGDSTADVDGGDSCEIINCDVEINKEAVGVAGRHNDYFIRLKGVNHAVLRNNLFYFSAKGVHLTNCYQALLADNLFKDIRASSTANPAAQSLTLDASRQTALINNSWENPDSLKSGETYPPGAATPGLRMALPFEEINGTAGTTLSAQGVLHPPTYTSVSASLVQDPVTNPLRTGMLAYDATKGLEAWDGNQWVRATGAHDAVNAKDFPTIQAAIDSLPTGGTVVVPEGLYTADTFPILIRRNKPIRLVGAGIERTILRNGNASVDVVRIEADHGAVEEMTIEGPSPLTGGTGHGVSIGSTTGDVLYPRLRNVLVRRAPRWSIHLDNTRSHFGLFIGLACIDNADEVGGDSGGIYVGNQCSRHRFEGCRINGFRNYGIWCSFGTGHTFADCSIDTPANDRQPSFKITGSLLLLLDKIYFSRSGVAKWFIALDGENRCITMSSCRFDRSGTGNPFAIDLGVASRSILIHNPEMTTDQAASGNNHIAFGGSLNEPILIGGVLSATDGFHPVQVSDGTTKSLILYPNKVRVPRLTQAEMDVIPDKIPGDIVFRLAGTDTPAGLKAYLGGTLPGVWGLPALEFLGSNILTSAAASVSVSFLPRDILVVLVVVSGTSTSDIPALRLNGEVGTSYWSRVLHSDTGSNFTNSQNVNANLARLFGVAGTGGRMARVTLSNRLGQSKLGEVSMQAGTGGAGTPGRLEFGGFEWVNPAQVHLLQLLLPGGGNLNMGSGLAVFGKNL